MGVCFCTTLTAAFKVAATKTMITPTTTTQAVTTSIVCVLIKHNLHKQIFWPTRPQRKQTNVCSIYKSTIN